MRSRVVTVALVLFAAIVWPVAAHAVECGAVVVFFAGDTDVLDIINLKNVKQIVSFGYFQNNGTFVGDAQTTIDPFARYQVTAPKLYALYLGAPKITDSYVRIRALSGGLISTTVTLDHVTREPHCITLPVS